MVAFNRKHDDDRIGAREMLGLALRAVAPPSGLRHIRSVRRNSSRSRGAHASAASPSPRAIGGRCSATTRPWTAIERRSVTKIARDLQRFRRRPADADAEPACAIERAEEPVSPAAPSAASAIVNSGSLLVRPLFAARPISPPIARRRRRAARRAAATCALLRAQLGRTLDRALRVAAAAVRGRDREEAFPTFHRLASGLIQYRQAHNRNHSGCPLSRGMINHLFTW